MKATHAYLGVKPCGCAVALACDDGDRHTANDVAGFIRSGYAVERVPIEDAAARIRRCTHLPAERGDHA